MYKILTASQDTYITNKIIANSFRATDANVGLASTLDLFKLYDESTISGSTEPIEISRALIKFDLEPLRALTSSIVDITHSSFKCYLKLHDVYGGQTVPTNFKLVVLPLSKSFDEGFGRDIVQFQDIDSANFITASTVNGTIAWTSEGAAREGLLGSADIDVITSGNLGTGIVSLASEQTFSSGEENLVVDVTRVISATLSNQIPDCGFRISFTGSQETDSKTRFVKRFSSRHNTNTRIRPKLIVNFNDAIQDHHEDFYFDITGSLFLNNIHRGDFSSILSGSSLTPITGNNCLLLRLMSGSLTMSYTGSQHKNGAVFQTGIYSATFAIPSNLTALTGEILNAGSATFTEKWLSLDGSVTYATNTLKVKTIGRTSFDNTLKKYLPSITNSKTAFRQTDKYRFRVFVKDQSINAVRYSKIPLEDKSIIVKDAYYQIRDANSGDVIVPFETQNNSTKLSSDSFGMFFDFYMDTLSPGRVYDIDIMLKEKGVDQVYTNLGARFRVDIA